MKNYTKYLWVVWLAVFVSSAVIIAVSIARGDRSYVLIVDGYLAGMALSTLLWNRLIRQQSEMITGLLALNQGLMDDNKRLVAIIDAMRLGIQTQEPPPRSAADGERGVPSANGRKPPSMY